MYVDLDSLELDLSVQVRTFVRYNLRWLNHLDRAVPDPCLSGPCDVNAVCHQGDPLNSEFTCTCNSPFQGDGFTCTCKCQ